MTRFFDQEVGFRCCREELGCCLQVYALGSICSGTRENVHIAMNEQGLVANVRCQVRSATPHSDTVNALTRYSSV